MQALVAASPPLPKFPSRLELQSGSSLKNRWPPPKFNKRRATPPCSTVETELDTDTILELTRSSRVVYTGCYQLLPPGRKALIVAMDQPRAIYSGALADFPGQVLDNLQSADVGAYLLTLSTARHVERGLAGRAVVISVSQDYQEPQQVVEQAVACGAAYRPGSPEVYPYSEHLREPRDPRARGVGGSC